MEYNENYIKSFQEEYLIKSLHSPRGLKEIIKNNNGGHINVNIF